MSKPETESAIEADRRANLRAIPPHVELSETWLIILKAGEPHGTK